MEEKIIKYRQFLKLLYGFKNQFPVDFPNNELTPMTVENIYKTLKNFTYEVPYCIICLITDNEDYDPAGFNLYNEISDLNMVNEYNPITLWMQSLFDLLKQYNMQSMPVVDPTTVLIETGLDTEWWKNHKKFFPYKIVVRTNLCNDKVEQHKYKISAENIDKYVNGYGKGQNIYHIFK